jgi:hypothetical protein
MGVTMIMGALMVIIGAIMVQGVSLGIMETMLREITIRFQHMWVLEPHAV